MIPDDLLYTEEHEWVRVDGDVITVGITDHAQQQLGDITFVELPAAGTECGAGEEMCVVESVKAASDIFAPVASTVSEANGDLEDAPELINKEPYGGGWICKCTGFKSEDLAGLMDAAAYAAFLPEE